MTEEINDLLTDLEIKLKALSLEKIKPIETAEKAIIICEGSLNKLRALFESFIFESSEEEIDFFKNIKPRFTSKLYYYICLFNLEIRRSTNGVEAERKYLIEQLETINRFKDSNIETYKYFKSNATFLDEKCFLRNNRDLRLFLDPIVYQFDAKFSTSHDHKIAIILAYDELELYIRKELAKLEGSHSVNQDLQKFNLRWTDKKVSLVELIYCLYAAGVINNGKAEISELAKFFEQHFDIELGDYYRKYLEIKSRKFSPTKFIDTIKSALLKKMEADLQ